MTLDKHLSVDVKGMHCASCSSRIERVVGDHLGDIFQKEEGKPETNHYNTAGP